METPPLFDLEVTPRDEVGDPNLLKTQTRIREMNDERISRQGLRQTLALRHAAIARLRRRRHEADEVDHEYWERRRNNIRLVE